ncbi:MAG: hypothetical protein HC869_06530 [Rhodospirillales bacterium]|nr:hypothetical protein [Rhodospirillales bacterium]
MAKHPNVGILEDVKLDAVNGQVSAKAKGTLLTSLLKAAGIHELGFRANSTIKRGKGTVEIALVLDNSGSMAGTYIADLRTAAQNLVDVVFTGFEGTEKVKVGVVPFAGSVNVGPSNINASWMDTTGLSPVHFENFAEPKTRFELLQQMDATWGGCVEVRPAPHDVTDSVPTETTPASLFVPMFNPDEPDGANSGGDSYGNNYLPDYGGSCPAPPPTCIAYKTDGVTCKTWSQPPVLSPKDAQARVCKYQGATISGSGPNFLCDSLPILPLTSDKASAKDLIQTLQAKGGTNILEGLMWGWRVLSPEPPFTEGKAYDDPDNDKFLIVMTDGENWHQARSNHNKSSYHSFGYASNGRLGTTYTTSALVAKMTAKTLDACQNAKALGSRSIPSPSGLRATRRRGPCWRTARPVPTRHTLPATVRLSSRRSNQSAARSPNCEWRAEEKRTGPAAAVGLRTALRRRLPRFGAERQPPPRKFTGRTAFRLGAPCVLPRA